MSAGSPEEINRLFQQYMREGDIDAVLTLYDSDVVFLNQSGEARHGLAELREELAPLASAKTEFVFDVKQVIQSGDFALVHTKWKTLSPDVISVYAIEVARRQSNGTWRWLIGDPYTVGKSFAS